MRGLRRTIRQPILITGAGGSIGSALALRLAVLARPPCSFWSPLKAISTPSTASGPQPRLACPMTPILGNAADVALVEHIFAAHRPRIVFHAAAYKHVPLMEEQPLAAIANNIFATETLTMAAAANHARLILLSTDKAVEPASVMGATKRVAEQIVLAAGGTVLRLGNVLASRDSVAELFAGKSLWAAPSPSPIPPPAATSSPSMKPSTCFSSPPRIPHPPLLAPDLPATHYISDLAHFMVRELAPGAKCHRFHPPRPGDKIAEQLWSGRSCNAHSLVTPAGSVQHLRQQSCPSNQPAPSRPTRSRARESPRRSRCPQPRRRTRALTFLVPDYTPSPSVLALSQQQGSQGVPMSSPS
jgi:hypothetical protein